MATTRSIQSPTIVRPKPWRLSAAMRKGVLVVHIASAGAWLGIDVSMAVLVFTALASSDPTTKALCYQALNLFVVWPVFASGMICLASGVVLGLGTSYGLFRFWWVAVKLALNLILTGLVLVALRPEVSALAEAGQRSNAGEFVTFVEDNIVFPPIVSPIALLVAYVLAVYKPWGRIRGRG